MQLDVHFQCFSIQMSALKACKFSAHLHSYVLRWISVELFPSEKPLAHVTELWWFLILFYGTPSANNC